MVMRFKTLLLIASVAPFAGGCNIYYYTAKNLLNEPLQLTEQICRHHDLRSEARLAWQEVRCQYPRCMFTAEFHDGFVNGFSEYLDRGGNAQPSAVPPKKYTRNKYLNADGHSLIQDYFLGFQYGTDVALATDQRKYLTVPVLLPTKPKGSPRFNVQRDDKSKDPTGEPLTPPRSVDSSGSTAVPNFPNFPVMMPGTSKPGAEGVLMSRPNSAPASGPAPMASSKFTRPNEAAPTVDVSATDRLPATKVPTGPLDPETVKQLIPIPAPPRGVPVLPDSVATPSVLDDLPMLPANQIFPGPLPVTNSTEAKSTTVILEASPKAMPKKR